MMYTDMMHGKQAIVTGARRGIGRAIIEEFAKDGVDIWSCARVKDADFETDMADLSEKYGVHIKPVYFDVTDRKDVINVLGEIAKEKEPIDILVNNAGVPYNGLMSMTSEADLKRVFDVNFFAQINIIQLVSRIMMRRHCGSIINIASVGGIETAPGYLAYGSSKAALIYATKVISHELGMYGIRVNAVAPGLTDTDMGLIKGETEIRKVIDRSSLGRMASPEEIARTVAFLASDAASFITGQVIIADGGRICV